MSTLARGVLHSNISLSDYTSWRIGGVAKKFYLPRNLDDLATQLQTISQDETIFLMGLGSNLLIRDGGIEGITIVTQGGLSHLSLVEDSLVRAEAGVSCAQMARFCAKNALGGAEFLAGIPGTIGGALAMNAGCYDGETWEYVEQVEVINRSGQRRMRLANEYQVSYRSVIPNFSSAAQATDKAEWFVAGYFRLRPAQKERALEKIRHLLDRRAATQPTSEPNCGSVFRNPVGEHAGRLIEACNLKGFTIGDASVSTKHANFIINQGKATASDIECLIAHIKVRVAEKFGIDLVQEVQVIGTGL